MKPPEGTPPDFSLVLGGPLHQFWRLARLSDEALGLVHRRVVFIVLVTWAPLMALSAMDGRLTGPGRTLPFLSDIGFQARFLVVAPLLILAEPIVHRRLRLLIEEFHVRRLVPPHHMERFDEALREAVRWRDSHLAEALLLAFVYAVGVLFAYYRYAQFSGDAWFVSADRMRPSPAGLWLVFVSLPLLQFLLLRWYFRLVVWARLLWRLSQLDLDLNATHPDRAGGLGFLGESLAAFLLIATAHGVLFAGMMADRIFLGWASFADFKLEVFAGAVFLAVVFVGPLTVFGPRLAYVKRVGLRQYGALGQTYVREFRSKWLSGAAPADEPLVGSGDIQSLADLGNSYASADQMRLIPIQPLILLYFVLAFLAPILPLALTVMSAEKLLDRLVAMLF